MWYYGSHQTPQKLWYSMNPYLLWVWCLRVHVWCGRFWPAVYPWQTLCVEMDYTILLQGQKVVPTMSLHLMNSYLWQDDEEKSDIDDLLCQVSMDGNLLKRANALHNRNNSSALIKLYVHNPNWWHYLVVLIRNCRFKMINQAITPLKSEMKARLQWRWRAEHRGWKVHGCLTMCTFSFKRSIWHG